MYIKYDISTKLKFKQCSLLITLSSDFCIFFSSLWNMIQWINCDSQNTSMNHYLFHVLTWYSCSPFESIIQSLHFAVLIFTEVLSIFTELWHSWSFIFLEKKIKRMTFFSFHFAQWNLRKSTTLSRLNKAVKICIIKNRYRRNQIGMSKEMCMDEIIGQCGDVHRHRSGKGRDGQGWEGNEEIGTEEMGMDKDERAMRGLTRRRWTRRRQWGDWHLHKWQHKEELGMGREKRAKRKWAWAGRRWAGRNWTLVRRRGHWGDWHVQGGYGQGRNGHSEGGGVVWEKGGFSI